MVNSRCIGVCAHPSRHRHGKACSVGDPSVWIFTTLNRINIHRTQRRTVRVTGSCSILQMWAELRNARDLSEYISSIRIRPLYDQGGTGHVLLEDAFG